MREINLCMPSIGKSWFLVRVCENRARTAADQEAHSKTVKECRNRFVHSTNRQLSNFYVEAMPSKKSNSEKKNPGDFF